MKITNVFFGEKKPKVDLLVAGCFQAEKSPPPELVFVDGSAYETAKQAIQKGRFSGKDGEVFSTFGEGLKEANEFVLLGLGKREDWKRERLRQKIATLPGLAKSRNAASIRLVVETFVVKPIRTEEAAELIPETLELAAYQFGKYQSKAKDDAKPELRSADLLYSKRVRKPLVEQALKRAGIISDAVVFTRNLINEPANIMPPRVMAERARQVARDGKLRCEVLGPGGIKRRKMGGIIAVSQGSNEPPQVVILEYGASYKKRGTICLVGKGVTFDTGGIAIKPSKDMEKMKYDMSGAAAVMGTMKAVSCFKPELHIVGIAPCVENMPSGRAQRPGDIIKMFNGKSVEVINTDAEGRLILGDALAYTARFKPNAVIDLATLTGACVVALGDKAIGLMGTDPALIRKVRDAGEAAGERCWELPLWEEYREQIKGHHSDILNVGTGGGGTITAGMFLKEFVPVRSWAHLDIAGTAWVDSDKPYRARGATGIGVRLLLELLRRW